MAFFLLALNIKFFYGNRYRNRRDMVSGLSKALVIRRKLCIVIPLIMLCVVIFPDCENCGREAVCYKIGSNPKNNRIIDGLIFELPDRRASYGGLNF